LVLQPLHAHASGKLETLLSLNGSVGCPWGAGFPI